MITNIDLATEVIHDTVQEWPQDDVAGVATHRLFDAGLLRPDPPAPYLHPVTAWQAKCSQCGYIEDDYGDFTAMSAVDVVDEVLDGGWVLEDDRLVCDQCQRKEIEQ